MASRFRAAIRERFVAWALRVRPPEPAPIILVQRRVYVLPTRAGFAFGGALMIMLLGSINYSLGLGYVLTFLLGGLGVAAIVHSFRNLVGLRITPGRCEPVFAHQIARFPIRVDNVRRDMRCAIRLSLPDAAEEEVDVPANGSAVADLPIRPGRRGWLALPRVTIATTYPLSLVRAWSYVAPDQRCLVYPAPAAHAPPLPMAAGRLGGARRGSSGEDDFTGLRSHQPADSPRHVAWKVVARQGGPLLTKQFSGDVAERVVLDWADLPPALSVEDRLSVLAAWVCQSSTQGATWALRLPGANLPDGSGDLHYHASLTALALYGQPQ